MKRRSLIKGLAVAGIGPIVSQSALAATVQVAPSNRVNLFLDSTSPFGASDWLTGSTPSISSLKILKSTGSTEFNLLLNMPTNLGIAGSGKKFLLDSTTFAGVSVSRISDTGNSVSGQCVDFAKEMIGSTSLTSTWQAEAQLSTLNLATLTKGTMIAYMGTGAAKGSRYGGTSGVGQHVGIFLGPAYNTAGVLIGIQIVHQNFFVSPFQVIVNGVNQGACPQSIAKHMLPLTDTSGIRSANKYWTIAI